MLKGLINQFREEPPTTKAMIEPIIISRADHSISRRAISDHALKVLYRLHEAGFSAYLVGGCVRDLMLGFKPKDFDVATNARPEEIRRVFKNCRLIGKRFRLAHVFFGLDIIEVATFRTHHENAKEQQAKTRDGMIVRDNVYGTIEDDAWRRDFRINALYYNIADFSIVDFTGGIDDIKTKTLHMIGDPEKRFLEDPVRLLRAVRFMGKLNISIAKDTEGPLTRLSHLLQQVSPARLFQEILKMLSEGALSTTFNLLQKYHLFGELFPQTQAVMQQPETQQLISLALDNTDQRVRMGKTVSPSFLFAILLWRPALQQAKRLQDSMPFYLAFEKAMHTVLKIQTQQLAITRKIQSTVMEICGLQQRMSFRRGKQPYRLLEHPRFRAAYDLLVLRAQAGEPVQELADWWSEFQTADETRREKMLENVMQAAPKKRRKRKKAFKKVINP